jgi:hypothetical protein
MGLNIDLFWVFQIASILLVVVIIIWFSVTEEDRDKKRMRPMPKGSAKKEPFDRIQPILYTFNSSIYPV